MEATTVNDYYKVKLTIEHWLSLAPSEQLLQIHFQQSTAVFTPLPTEPLEGKIKWHSSKRRAFSRLYHDTTWSGRIVWESVEASLLATTTHPYSAAEGKEEVQETKTQEEGSEESE